MALRATILAAAGLAALLAGCGGPGRSHDDAPNAAAGPSTPASEAAEVAAPADAASASPVAGASASSAPLTDTDPVACSVSIGAAKAARMVKACLAVSPATHPPCNAANSCAMIEDEIARGCALLGDDAKGEPACTPAPASGAAAAAAVRRYYDAIAAGDFDTAYGTWGDDGRNSNKSFEAFRAGFAHTRAVRVTPGQPGEVEGGAGSLYVTVPVSIDSELDNGAHQHFTGEYMLRQSSGAGGPSQGWHIYSAKLKGN